MNKNNKIFSTLLIVFFTITISVSGQVPVIEIPNVVSPFTIQTPGQNVPNSQVRQFNSLPNVPNPNVPNPNNSMEIYERDMREMQRRNAELNRILQDYSERQPTIHYDFPSQLGRYGTQYYQQALEKLSAMLRGDIPLNLKDAVFAVENAFFENQLPYSDYSNAINKLAQTAYLKGTQDGHNWNNPVTKNIMLFRAMADTLEIKVPQMETSIVSYPMQYDFDDFWGKNDWTKMFVSKLLATNSGQCRSLPLLYLILCEMTGAEAHLAYSPSHSYIKFQDNSGNWHNLELTNGSIVSDAFVVGSGYVASEAIRNGTYLQAQTKEQVIAGCISDLAMGYIDKFGYDSFIKQCLDTVFKYDPNNLSALKIQANYSTRRAMYVVSQLGRPSLEVLKSNYPRAYALVEEMHRAYERVDATGHRDMPAEAYEVWLRSVNEEKERREHNERYNRIIRGIR